MTDEKSERKPRSRTVHYLLIFGINPEVDKPPFEGEIHKFDNKKELTKKIEMMGIKPHKKGALAGACINECDDGRAAMIFSGPPRILIPKITIM